MISHSGWIHIILVWLFALLFVFTLPVWFWHYLAPVGWHELRDARLSKIQAVLFSGGIGAVVSIYIRKYFNP